MTVLSTMTSQWPTWPRRRQWTFQLSDPAASPNWATGQPPRPLMRTRPRLRSPFVRTIQPELKVFYSAVPTFQIFSFLLIHSRPLFRTYFVGEESCDGIWAIRRRTGTRHRLSAGWCCTAGGQSFSSERTDPDLTGRSCPSATDGSSMKDGFRIAFLTWQSAASWRRRSVFAFVTTSSETLWRWVKNEAYHNLGLTPRVESRLESGNWKVRIDRFTSKRK